VSQTALDNLIRVARWDYGTATCTDPVLSPPTVLRIQMARSPTAANPIARC
jgi:hypothetical protein